MVTFKGLHKTSEDICRAIDTCDTEAIPEEEMMDSLSKCIPKEHKVGDSSLMSWIPWNLSFRYIFLHEKKTPNSAVTPLRQSQFTPKMKANTVPHLLSSLVWIDQYNECNRMTSFMDFMMCEARLKQFLFDSWTIQCVMLMLHKKQLMNMVQT